MNIYNFKSFTTLYFRHERLLKFFDIIHDESPQGRRGALAVKYYLKWKRDHLPQCFVILRNVLENDFSDVCHHHQEAAETDCRLVRTYFSNNCDDSS